MCRQRRSTSKLPKVDRKFLLFGEKEGEEGSSSTSLKEEHHFVASIQRTLHGAMDGLLTTAEVTDTQSCTHACAHTRTWTRALFVSLLNV